jgi:site-specific DNA-methyltransferase (adenine-specific)
MLNKNERRFLNEDSLEYIKKIDNESVDLIITDPPYGINYKKWDNYTSEAYTEFIIELLEQSHRVLKKDGSMWMFFAPTMIKEILDADRETLFHNKLENWSVWARQKGRGASKKLKSVREDVFHLVKDPKNFTWNEVKMLREVIVPYMKDGRPRGWFIDSMDGMRKRWTGLGNVWNYSSAFWKSKTDPQIHPAQKPVMMLVKLILMSSNEGETVLDPFMGSGSTGVASWLTNRNFIGIEKDTDTYNKAIEWNKNIDIEKYSGFTRNIDKFIKSME